MPAADNHVHPSADRAIGTLLGLAIGDALGTTLEFTARDSMPPVTDIVGGGPFGLAPGQWTDDTSMALCLADSLIAAPGLDVADLQSRFLSWMRDGAYSPTGRCFDIGMTTRRAIERYRREGVALAGDTSPQAAGNGSIMRLAPVAIRWWRDPARAERLAREQSRTTHGATECLDACALLARSLALAIAGHARTDVLHPSPEPEWAPAIRNIAEGSWQTKDRDAIRSSGYVVHTLEAAYWCVDRTASFQEAVLLAVNLADDADTVGAVTGQLAGALYGLSGMPADWVARVWDGERIRAMAGTLFEQSLADPHDRPATTR